LFYKLSANRSASSI